MLRIILLAVGVAVLGVLASLALSGESGRADFVITASAVRTIDPHRVSWLDEVQIADALFEGLTRLNPETLQPEAGVAEAWEVSPDDRTWTFHLRPTARWSNGAPVTAADFRFAWLRVLDPRVEAQYASLLFVIDGAEAYYRSRLDDDPGNDLASETVAVVVDGAHTLRVRLARPCGYWLDLTAFPTLAPVYPPTLERDAYRDGRCLRATQHLWTRPGRIIGNGAFTLERWDFKRSLRLVRNPHYWQPDVSNVASIEVYLAADRNAALVAYETGRVDCVRGLDSTVARRLLALQRAGRRDDLHVGDRFATFFLRVNCRRPPLDDPRVRQALSLAVDRAALCEHVLGLGEKPATTYVPPAAIPMMLRSTKDGGVVRYRPPVGLGDGLSRAERLARARELLHESGFDPMTRPIEIAYAPEPANQRRVVEALQAIWERDLGIRVVLRVQEPKVLSARIRDLDYDLARSDWYGDYLDPATFLEMFVSGSGQNRTGWSSAGYDALVAAATMEDDPARRYELFAEAERVLCCDGLPIIPLYFKRDAFLLRQSFTGLNDSIRDLLPIQRVRRVD